VKHYIVVFLFYWRFRILYPKKCFRSLQLCNCLVVLYKIICLQFFILILLSVLIFYVIHESANPLLLKLKLWECMLQNPLNSHLRWLSPDLKIERKNLGGYATCGIFERLWQTCALENNVQFGPILCCYQWFLCS